MEFQRQSIINEPKTKKNLAQQSAVWSVSQNFQHDESLITICRVNLLRAGNK